MRTETAATRNDQTAPLRHVLRRVRRHRPPAPGRERELLRRIRQGSGAALDELVRGYLPLVVEEARAVRRRGIDLLDLIAEGTVELVKAARGHDAERAVCFAPVARRAARRAMLAASGD